MWAEYGSCSCWKPRISAEGGKIHREGAHRAAPSVVSSRIAVKPCLRSSLQTLPFSPARFPGGWDGDLSVEQS